MLAELVTLRHLRKLPAYGLLFDSWQENYNFHLYRHPALLGTKIAGHAWATVERIVTEVSGELPDMEVQDWPERSVKS